MRKMGVTTNPNNDVHHVRISLYQQCIVETIGALARIRRRSCDYATLVVMHLHVQVIPPQSSMYNQRKIPRFRYTFRLLLILAH